MDEFSSYFIRTRALFGNYPTQERVDCMEQKGVRYFVNLTDPNEKMIEPYVVSPTSTKIDFTIADHSVPSNWFEFSKFICMITQIIVTLPSQHFIYIHCRGGHGRAGVVVATLLSHIFQVEPRIALGWTKRFHGQRPTMRERWRLIGSPQNFKQKNFVVRFFKPIILHRTNYKDSAICRGFCRFAAAAVETRHGHFSTLEAAFLAAKFPSLREDCAKVADTDIADFGRKLRKRKSEVADWTTIRKQVLFDLTRLKLEQHPTIKQNLLSTGMRPIKIMTRQSHQWPDWTGQNVTGDILVDVRKKCYQGTI
jgi:predicted NAD-dependent protein-ADP-ribosyltransferase YbiA (DUF1768 family)